ncbi:MAG: sensor histidine kinase [Lachnospiraceae bacterium]|nr:sensor histidine kinase [Lachnospiraceae bacterium]
MKRGKNKSDWFEVFAYLLMTGCIVLFILGIVRSRWEWMILLLLLLLCVGVGFLLAFLRQRRTANKYRELQRWMQEGDLEDRDGLSAELQEDLELFFASLDRKYTHENARTGIEYAALQNQINPHFLYNTLDAIRSQALAAGQPEIAEMTGKMSRFYRYSIKNRGDLVPLAEELSNVKDYFSIQRYRFEDRFSLEILCEEPEILHYYIPKMTFQPLVENALYHGLEPHKGGGQVTLRLTCLGKSILIVVHDDGIGMDEATLEKVRQRLYGKLPEEDSRGKRSGIAVYNVNKRLQILFGDAYGLQYTSAPGMGTDVEIRIPLVSDENRGLRRRI